MSDRPGFYSVTRLDSNSEPMVYEPEPDESDFPAIGETCKECDKPIVRERTAIQLRKAGCKSFWCCGWDCVVKLAIEEGAKH